MTEAIADLQAKVDAIRESWDVPSWELHMRLSCPTGVYAIGNCINGKLYIGGAKILYRRKKRHLLSLRTGVHYNASLQQDWNELGEDSFYFAVIEFVHNYAELRGREQHWMDAMQVAGLGYNILPDATSHRGHVASEETKRKMSIARAGKVRGRMSDEARKNISEARLAYYARLRAQ